MSCSSTIKLSRNHKSDTQMDALSVKVLNIFKNQNQRFGFFKKYYKTLFYRW